MASGGKPPPPPPPPSLPSLLGKAPLPSLPSKSPHLPSSSRSWAKVVASPVGPKPESSPILPKAQFERLKRTVQDFVSLDPELHYNIQERMQGSAYAKFLGRSLSLDQIKPALLSLWKDFGVFTIADLPNGYYFIRFEDPDALSSVIFEGPWSIGGMVLQLIPWKPNFQPAYEKLCSAAVWIQIHNLPMEIWQADLLESIASQLGRLLKIDENTISNSRAKYARVCLEIDLSLPLKQGTWIGFGSREAFITFQYERLPVFCFHCGLVGHGVDDCPSSVGNPVQSEDQFPESAPAGPGVSDSFMHLDVVNQEDMATLQDPIKPPSSSSLLEESATSFGPWMIVQRRRGRGAGFASASRRQTPSNPPSVDTCHSDSLHESHVAPHHDFSGSRGRGGIGGRLGGRGRGGFPASRWSFDRFDPTVSHNVSYPEDLNNFSTNPEILPVPNSLSGPGECSYSEIALNAKQPPDSHLSPLPSVPSSLPPLPPSSSLVSSPVHQRPSPLPGSSSELPPTLLLTSAQPEDPSSLPPSAFAPMEPDAHSILVSKVSSALSSRSGAPPVNASGEASCMEEDLLSESSEEHDIDMISDPLLRQSKLEAIARRDTGKAKISRKKGRKNLQS